MSLGSRNYIPSSINGPATHSINSSQIGSHTFNTHYTNANPMSFVNNSAQASNGHLFPTGNQNFAAHMYPHTRDMSFMAAGQAPTFTHNVVCPTVQPSLSGSYQAITQVPPLQNNTMPYMRPQFYAQHFPPGAFFMPQGHMPSVNQVFLPPQHHAALMRQPHPNANVNPGAVGGPAQPPYGHPMNHHSQQMQETPNSIQMNYNQHTAAAAYMANAPTVNVSGSTAQPTQANYVGGGGTGGPPTSMHLMGGGPAGNPGASQVNVDNSNQQNHQYNRSQNDQTPAPVPLLNTGGLPVVSEAANAVANSGSSTTNTAKPARQKIIIKDPTSNKVVDVADWKSKGGSGNSNNQEVSVKSGTKVSVSVADSKESSKQKAGDKKGVAENDSKRKDTAIRKHEEKPKAAEDENKTVESTTSPPVVNGHVEIPAQISQNSTDVNSSSFDKIIASHTGDLSKVDFDKVKDFVPEKASKGVEPILAAKSSIDLDTDVAPSPTVATVTDQSPDGSCPGQEVTVYKFDLKKNSQAVIESDKGECIIVQASPSPTPDGGESASPPSVNNPNVPPASVPAPTEGKHDVDQSSSDNVAPTTKVVTKNSQKDKYEDKASQNEKDLPKRTDKFVSSSAAASNVNNPASAPVIAGTDRKPHVKGKDAANDRKMDFANRAPDDKSVPDNQGGNFKSTKKDKRKKKEKEFEKRADPNLLSAYDVQNDHPVDSKKAAVAATAKNSTSPPVGDGGNAATVNASVAKPYKLGLGTITAVENSSTSDVPHSEGSQHGAEMQTGNAESEKVEEETCWEDKTLADDTPENGNKASKFVADNDNTPTTGAVKSSSNARKVYDRDFLLSKQKAAGSLKKAPFTEEPHLKDIVTLSPQFLQPLADNVPVNDFRDFSQSSHSYGNNSFSGSGNDFAPDFLRRQRPTVGGPTNSRGKSGMGSGNNLQGGGNKSFRSDRGSHNTQTRMQFTTNVQNQDMRLTESENAWKSKRKQDFTNTNEAELKTETIKRQTRAILNKLTPQNFSLLSAQMAQLDIDTDERVGDVIDITFEKACLEPNFAEAYANMCKTVLSIRSRLQEQAQAKHPTGDDSSDNNPPPDPVVTLFRRQLLNRCQQEFQREKDYEKEYEGKKAVIEKSTENEKEKKEKLENLELDMKKSKKKSLGNNRFIGELFKLDFLTERIMHSCIESLLKNSKDEDSLECMCKLLTTIGRKMDHETGRNLMDQYFKRIQNMVVNKQTSSRIRFMLQDVIDLRANKWESKKESAPKTIDQIHKEAREEDIQIKVQAEMMKNRNRNDRQNSYNDRKFQHNNRLGGNNGPASQQEWQPQTAGSNAGRQTDIRMLLDKTVKTGALDVKLGSGFGTGNLGGNRSTWSKGSVGTSQKNNSSGPTSSQGSSGSNRFGALQDAFAIGSDDQESNRSISSDHRNRGPSEIDRQQSRDESVKHIQSLSRGERNQRGGNMYASSNGRGDSPADRSKFVSSGGSRFAGPSGSSGSASGRSYGGGGSGKQSIGATYPNQNSAPAAEIPALSMEALVNKVSGIITEFIEIQDVKEYCEVVQSEVPQSSHSDFIKCCIDYAIDKNIEVCKETGRLVYELVKTGIIGLDSFKSGIMKTLINAVDLSCDVPRIWANYGLILGQSMRDQLSISQLPEMIDCLLEEDKARYFVAEIVLCYAQLTSKDKVAKAWTVSKVKWRQFTPSYISDEQLQDFLNDKELTFTLSANNSEAADDLVSYEAPLLELVKKNPYESVQVFEWIQRHLHSWLGKPECIQLLTRVVCKACFKRDVTPVSFDNNLFESRKVVLLRYINHEKDLMFHAIYSIQLLASDYKYPAGLLDSIFRCLYDADVITSQAFLNWRDNKDPKYNRGKGSCTVQLKQFMTYVAEGDESESD